MFRAWDAHPQAHGMVLCQLAAPDLESTPVLVQLTDITRTQYTKCHLWKPPEDEQVMLETRSGP
jgi:hypothetical protein